MMVNVQPSMITTVISIEARLHRTDAQAGRSMVRSPDQVGAVRKREVA
jgi:hypothetical protein